MEPAEDPAGLVAFAIGLAAIVVVLGLYTIIIVAACELRVALERWLVERRSPER